MRKKAVHCADVVEVAVREEYERRRKALRLEERADGIRLRSGVDDLHCGGILPENYTVRVNGTEWHYLSLHGQSSALQ